MTIEKARKIMGKSANEMSDDQVMEFIGTASVLSDIFIDMWEKMSPEERIKYEKGNTSSKKTGSRQKELDRC